MNLRTFRNPPSGPSHLPPPDTAALLREEPDLYLRLEDAAGWETAAGSLWLTNTPSFAAERVALLGHVRMRDREAGTALLRGALRTLRETDRTLLIGPMNGSTWGSYRLVTDAGAEPPFLLEPWNPPEAVEAFRMAGFEEWARYHSGRVPLPAPQDPRLPRVRDRLAEAGVTTRAIDLRDYEDELRRIHTLSLTAFRRNLLYTDLPWHAFAAQYQAVRPWIDPRFCLLAEHGPQLVGFLFGIPDHGGAADRLIAKTLAVLPDRRFAGLGAVLTEQLHSKAEHAGYREVIHALEYEGNRSSNLTRRYGEIMRRYALFATRLSR